MVLAERIPNGLVIDVGERLKRLHDRRADGRLPGVEGAMRLSASRNLPDAIVGHQRQRAVDIVSVSRLQKAIHKCVVVARHFGSSRSPASSQRGTAPAALTVEPLAAPGAWAFTNGSYFGHARIG